MGRTNHQMHSDASNQTDQSDAVRFLADGAGTGLPAQRIDTHGAIVFLIGDRALKIKRAVKYDYMDLSTLAKRHALLDREFELNRATAPSIYRGVIPIVRHPDGSIGLGGDGEIVEWALSMNRFPAAAELTRIAEEHGIDDDLAQSLGQSIARYHRAAPVSDLDGATLIGEILDELERVFGAMTGALSSDTERFIAKCRTLCADHANEMHRRSRGHHVRRCHGDLHLRNIVMIGGIPTPFDALEFDERLGTCDTLYDLAFLLMDLDHQAMPHPANLVLNAYLDDAAADPGDAGLALLPLYLSIRAAIRAMVDLQTLAVAANGDDLRQDARAYLTRALDYLDPAAPVLVAFGGFSGTGKTTIARAIAHRIGAVPGAVHLRSDVVRKKLLHRPPLDHLGPDGYTPLITARTYATMRQWAGQVLEQGHPAILDAVHSDPAARLAVEDLARTAGCGFVGFWLETPIETRLRRVAARGPDASDADAAVVTRQAQADPGPIGWHRIDTDRPTETVIRAVTEILAAMPAATIRTSGGEHVG